MRKGIIIIVSLLCLACKKTTMEPPPRPDNLISKEKMVAIIEDMLLLSAAKGVNKQIIESNTLKPDTYIYEKHDIDSVQFKLSNAYYAHDVDGYARLYQRVEKNLERKRENFQSQIEFERKKRDSVIKRNKRRDSINRVKQRRRSDSIKKLDAKNDRLEKLQPQQQ